MKRAIISTLIIIFSALSVFAASIQVAPYSGAYGVPMASPYYTGGEWDKKYGGPPNHPLPDGSFDDANYYSEDEIIAIAAIEGVTESEFNNRFSGEDFTVSVSCPNGLYFVSQSNPAFKRPFELYLVWKSQTYFEYRETISNVFSVFTRWGDGESDQDARYDSEVLSEQGDFEKGREFNGFVDYYDGDPEKGSYLINSQTDFIYHHKDGLIDTNERREYRNISANMWCDVILILPGEIVQGTDTLVVTGENGRTTEYPLIEADDYTATVTLTFKYGDLEKSITIPFSGYYERGQYEKEEDACSLLVEPNSNAAHLSISRDRGSWVTVGDLQFMMSTFRPDGSTTPKRYDPVIFASSSSDPFDKNAAEFRMVHSSVTFNTPLTNTNSIPFDVRIQRTGTSGTSNFIFDGTGSVSDVEQAATSGSYDFGIWPDCIPAYLQHSELQMDYYGYEGEIAVMMDGGNNIMKPGRYTGTVYIHVVSSDQVVRGM